MSDINEIISQEAINGLLEAAKAAQTLDSAITNITKSQVTFAEKTTQINAAQQQSAQLTNEQAKALKQIEKEQQASAKAAEKQAKAADASRAAIEMEANSIAQLKLQNKELIKLRDSLTTKTKEGRKAISDLNKQIDENNKIVKENSSALEKQKINVGNYISSWGPFQGVATMVTRGIGIMKIAFASLKTALISSGVGALVVALGSLIAYFTQTERGADKLQKAIAGFKAVIAVVGDRFKTFGEALSLLFTGKFAEASDKFKATFEDIGKEIKEEYGTARKLAEEFDRIADARRNEMVILEERKLRATELLEVAKSEENSLQEKLAAYYEANNLLKLNREFVNSLNEAEKAALIEQASIRDLSEDEQIANQQRLTELAREQKEAQSEVNSLLKLGNKLKKEEAEVIATQEAAAASRKLEVTRLNALGVQQIEIETHADTLELKEQMDIDFTAREIERIQQVRDERIKAAQEYTSQIAAIGQTMLDFNQFLIDSQTKKMEQAKAYELQLAGDNAAKREAIEKKYDKEATKLKIKQAKQDKAQALFSAIIKTAQAVLSGLAYGPPLGYIFAALNAVLGAVQIGVIASQPIPQFAKGTKSARRGMAWVGERGRELIYGRDGLMMSPGHATLMNLKGGERIFSNPETESLMRAAKGADDETSKKLLQEMQTGNREIVKAIKSKPVLYIDAKGNRITERQGNYFRTYLNKKLG